MVLTANRGVDSLWFSSLGTNFEQALMLTPRFLCIYFLVFQFYYSIILVGLRHLLSRIYYMGGVQFEFSFQLGIQYRRLRVMFTFVGLTYNDCAATSFTLG